MKHLFFLRFHVWFQQSIKSKGKQLVMTFDTQKHYIRLLDVIHNFSNFLKISKYPKFMLKTARKTWKSIFNKNNLYDAHLMCFFMLYKGVSKPCNNIDWSLCHTPTIETPKVTFICKKCSKLRHLLNCKVNFVEMEKNPKIIWA